MTIKLYCFKPAGGLPDASPFVVKVMTLLKLAGLDYATDGGGYARAPKGKLPYIDDNGVIVADSTFIRFHLEDAHGVDFDDGLTDEQKAIGWCAEKMCEEHLYWLVARAMWMDDANFERGPAKWFNKLPAPARPLAKWYMRRRVGKNLHSQGIGRHSAAEADRLGVRDIEALAALIGDKPFLLGDAPHAADATVFAFLASIMAPIAESAMRDAALAKPSLVAYRDRMMARFFPDCVKS
jgi:glutathione S-transferase